MYQRILGDSMLAVGLIYGAALLISAFRNREAVRAERGSLAALAAMEIPVFFCASMGISDYLIHTLLIKRLNLVSDDRHLPGTLVACCLLPGAIFAWTLLRVENPVDIVTLAVCGACVMVGALAGTQVTGRLSGALIGRIMRIALIVSFLVLVGKIALSSGETGTAMGLSGPRLYIAGVLCFLTALINMFGIPMKPTWTALFLILGLSPLAVLTMVLVLGELSPLAGGLGVVRSGNYQKKMAPCGVIFGSMGAILGTLLAVSLPAIVLNGVLLAVMLLAIASMFRK